MSNLLQQQMIDNFSFKNNTTVNDVLATADGKTAYTQSVAQYLHDTRVNAKLNLADIANTLRISQHYLQAIEDCNLEVLPERVYTLGFIRSYAKHLGLNGDDIVKRFKNEILGEESHNTTYVATKLTEESSLPSRTLIYAISVLLVLGAIGSWLYADVFSPSDSQATPMPAVIKSEIDQNLMTQILPPTIVGQDTTATTPTMAINSEDNTVNNPTDTTIESINHHGASAAIINTSSTGITSTQSGVPANIIRLVFTELSWIEIKDSHGKILLSKDMNHGESYDMIPQDGMRFSTGNAGGIQIQRAGQTDFTMGKHGEIIKNIALDSPRFTKP